MDIHLNSKLIVIYSQLQVISFIMNHNNQVMFSFNFGINIQFYHIFLLITLIAVIVVVFIILREPVTKGVLEDFYAKNF